MINLDMKQSRKVNTMIKQLCSNCVANGHCMLLDDQCVQLISNQGLYCNYFKKYVLPLNRDLHVELLSAEGKAKTCEMCNSLYIPTGKKQRFCSECRRKRHSEASKKYQSEKNREIDNLG